MIDGKWKKIYTVAEEVRSGVVISTELGAR